jgi:hypothetical protein
MSFVATPYIRIDLFSQGLTALDKMPTFLQLRKLINFSLYFLKYAGREPGHFRDVVIGVSSPLIVKLKNLPLT